MLIRKIKGGNESLPPSGNQVTIIINESGLYSLILSSKMPNAKRFKRWERVNEYLELSKSGAVRKGDYITEPQFYKGTYKYPCLKQNFDGFEEG